MSSAICAAISRKRKADPVRPSGVYLMRYGTKVQKSAAALCLCLMTLLFSHGSGIAQPRRLLKGITIISYSISLEKAVFGEGCRIDQSSLATALQFVANQSTKLKVMPWEEEHRRFTALLATRDKLEIGSDKFVAADKAAGEFVWVPSLLFYISPIEVSGTCVGIVKAELTAYLEDTHMLYRTHTPVYRPEVQIWSNTYIVTGPQRTFTDQASNAAETLLKALVNDWSAAQDLPE